MKSHFIENAYIISISADRKSLLELNLLGILYNNSKLIEFV